MGLAGWDTMRQGADVMDATDSPRKPAPWRAAVAKKQELEDLLKSAASHHAAGRLADAVQCYQAALEIAPGHGPIVQNLGVVAALMGDHAKAVDCFDRAIAAEPRYAAAHYNRAVSLDALGRTSEAIRGFSMASVLEPGHYESHRALGFLLLAAGDRGRALDHFARTYELRRGEDRSGLADRSLRFSNRSKLLHDAEQFRYLADRVRDGRRFDRMAGNYQAVGQAFAPVTTELAAGDIERLGEDYNTAIHLREAPELAGSAVRKRSDSRELSQSINAAGSGAVFADDVLTPQALAALKRYLLESTIWHDFSHIGGFVASYLEDGLACPLVLQIADELRGAFPELLGEHPLSQAWAFKGLQRNSAVDVHADDACISVNLWVTATEANRQPGRGGLAVCTALPPPEWAIRGYAADRERIVAFLEQNAGHRVVVPYRENRAVLFQSRLFHYSDRPDFAEGYENHRVNVTLLFGRATGRTSG
jgi:tetratricopeptide (TPR) repeat protein